MRVSTFTPTPDREVHIVLTEPEAERLAGLLQNTEAGGFDGSLVAALRSHDVSARAARHVVGTYVVTDHGMARYADRLRSQ